METIKSNYKTAVQFHLEAAMGHALENIEKCREALSQLPKGAIYSSHSRRRKRQIFQFQKNGKKAVKYLSSEEAEQYQVALDERERLRAQLTWLYAQVRFLAKQLVDANCSLSAEVADICKSRYHSTNVPPADPEMPPPKARNPMGDLSVITNALPYRPEELRHKTGQGFLVRSKNEVIITNELASFGLNFVYEPPIKLGDEDMLPDFVIFPPDGGLPIILECFGKINDDDYWKKCVHKLAVYQRNGFSMGDRLIVLFLRSDESVDIEQLEKTLCERLHLTGKTGIMA